MRKERENHLLLYSIFGDGYCTGGSLILLTIRELISIHSLLTFRITFVVNTCIHFQEFKKVSEYSVTQHNILL